MGGMDDKQKTSVRLSSDARRLIKALSKKLGISQTAIIELAIRGMAEKEKIK